MSSQHHLLSVPLFPCCSATYDDNQSLLAPCCLTEQCNECTLKGDFSCVKCRSDLTVHALERHIELTCLVCYERITDSPVYLHRCKHAFCSECFRQSVQAQVSQGKIKIASKCPQCLENNVSNEILKKVLSLNEY